MGTEASQESADILRALLDETRLKIAGCLAIRPRPPSALTAELGLSHRDTVKHLSMLEHFGIVRRRPEGEEFELDVQALHEMKKRLFYGGDPTPARDEESAILNRFVEGEHLKQLPSKHTHRVVVLRWLAEKFERGERYPERRVNEVLEDHHPDYASLRRALVDYGFMDREGGFYWRVKEEPAAP